MYAVHSSPWAQDINTWGYQHLSPSEGQVLGHRMSAVASQVPRGGKSFPTCWVPSCYGCPGWGCGTCICLCWAHWGSSSSILEAVQVPEAAALRSDRSLPCSLVSPTKLLRVRIFLAIWWRSISCWLLRMLLVTGHWFEPLPLEPSSPVQFSISA